MLCYVMLCYVMLCYVMLCYVMFSMNNQRQMFTCESRTVTQRVTKGHQIVVHLQPERRRLLTIQQRNQIIHRTIVDFASISYLNFSRSHKDNREVKRDVYGERQK